MLVTLAGHDIFKGRALLKASTPTDYSNFIVACLAHDIGYVRGVVKGDDDNGYVVDGTGRKISLPRGSSDAALAPHHVERSKLFVLDRVAAVEELDSARIARAIEFTQFPYASSSDEKQRGMDEDGSLLRAADLIGQLGDPNYLRKANALYYEFEEIGLNKQLGYESPADIVDKYPQFLLEQHFSTHPGRYRLSQCYLARALVGCRPLQQCISCRARATPFGTTAVAKVSDGPRPATARSGGIDRSARSCRIRPAISSRTLKMAFLSAAYHARRAARPGRRNSCWVRALTASVPDILKCSLNCHVILLLRPRSGFPLKRFQVFPHRLSGKPVNGLIMSMVRVSSYTACL